MKLIKFFFLPLCPFLFYSCLYRKMCHFNEADRMWLNAYSIEDTVHFVSGKDTDWVVIIEKRIFDKTTPFISNEGQLGEDFHAYAYIVGNLYHKACQKKIKVDMTKYNTETDAFWGFVAGNRYGLCIRDERNRSVDGVNNDTIIVDDENSRINREYISDCEFEYLIWSKHEGLIEYKLTDGNKYVKKKN